MLRLTQAIHHGWYITYDLRVEHYKLAEADELNKLFAEVRNTMWGVDYAMVYALWDYLPRLKLISSRKIHALPLHLQRHFVAVRRLGITVGYRLDNPDYWLKANVTPAHITHLKRAADVHKMQKALHRAFLEDDRFYNRPLRRKAALRNLLRFEVKARKLELPRYSWRLKTLGNG